MQPNIGSTLRASGPHSSPAPPAARRIVFAAGGTAGHIYPALALAQAYREDIPNVEILFVGAPNGLETHLVPEAGYRLLTIPGSPYFGVDWKGRCRAAADLARGILQARQTLRREQSQLVLGFGGYASAASVLGALSLRLPTAIYEPNEAAGLTNRWLGRMVSRIYAGSAAAGRSFNASKTLATGVPVRASIRSVGERRSQLPPPSDDRNILVTGGSLGSSFLNRHVPTLLAQLRERGVPLSIWHQSGFRDLEAVRRDYAAINLPARVDAYIEHAEEAYEWAHFAIICAGATTLAEVSSARLPVLVSPLANASEQHQVANATAFAEQTGLPWVSDQDWTTAVPTSEIERLLTDPHAYELACQRLAATASNNAAATIVADCERLLLGI